MQLDPESAQWRVDSAKWRSELGVNDDYHPYSASLDLKKAGLLGKSNKRTLDLLDCGFLQVCKRHKKSPQHAGSVLRNYLMDVSQGHCRRAISGSDGIARCLFTSSRIFCFEQRRLLTPKEHFMLQGFERDVQLPEGSEGLSSTDARRMAGEGMGLPCIATLLWALRLTKTID